MKRIRSIIIVAALCSVIQGCYGDINISLGFPAPGLYSCDSSRIFFFHIIDIGRPAEGLRAFPDGGKPKTLYRKVTFRSLDVSGDSLITIMDFGSLPFASSRWKYALTINADTVRFMLEPVSGWMKELKWGLDTSLIENYHGWFMLDTRRGTACRDTAFKGMSARGSRADIKTLGKLTSGTGFREWGIDLDKIAPAGRNDRISDLEKLRGNQNYRDAVIELLSVDLTDNEITEIIDEISRLVNEADGYESQMLRMKAEGTLKKLDNLRSAMDDRK